MFCWFGGFMKTTFDLPEDLIMGLKLRSVRERRKLKEVAAEVIRLGLDLTQSAQPEAPSLPEELAANKDGFPVYRCRPGAPASKMSVEALIALEQEALEAEDLRHGGIAP